MQTPQPSTKPVTFSTTRQEFLGHKDKVTAAFELSDGRFASASHDKTIRIWEGPTCTLTITDSNQLRDMIQLKDGNLAVVSFPNHVNIYSLKDGSKINSLKHNKKVSKLLQLSDGTLAVGTEKGLQLWDLENGKSILETSGHTNSVAGMCELSDGSIVTGSLDRSVIIWSRKGMILKTIKHSNSVNATVALQDGRIAFAAGSDIEIAKLDGTIEQNIKHTGGSVKALIQLHDGRLVSGSSNNTIKVWDLNGNEKQKLQSDFDVSYLSQTKDGTLISASYKKVQLWVPN